jgi:hypothetical protein
LGPLIDFTFEVPQPLESLPPQISGYQKAASARVEVDYIFLRRIRFPHVIGNLTETNIHAPLNIASFKLGFFLDVDGHYWVCVIQPLLEFTHGNLVFTVRHHRIALKEAS